MVGSTLHEAKSIMGECHGTGFIGRWNQLGCKEREQCRECDSMG